MQEYRADKIFDGREWRQGILQVAQGRVNGITTTATTDTVMNFPGCFIAPAYIDLQVYGANGRLLAMDPTADALQTLSGHSMEGGTVLCLPTVATNTKQVFYNCIDAVKAYWKNGGKGIGGLHLEGPWINKEKRGAHVAEYIHAPQVEEVHALLEYGKGVIKMITLAPETCAPEIIELLMAHNILLSAGHSNASYEEACAAFDAGIPAATHLYNAMSPLQHREPGVVGACFLHPRVKASIIPDGYHASFDAVRIAKKQMGERLFAITDAVTATEAGPYRHRLTGGDRYECNGTLSGSALTMHKAFQNLVWHCGISVEEALRMCSFYPAQLAGFGEYGSIQEGAASAFLVINESLDLVRVITPSPGNN